MMLTRLIVMLAIASICAAPSGQAQGRGFWQKRETIARTCVFDNRLIRLTFDLSYPQVKGTAARRVNRAIAKELHKNVADYLDSCDPEGKANERGPGESVADSCSLTWQSNTLVSMRCFREYSGRVHPFRDVRSFNFRPSDGHAVTPAELFLPHSEGKLLSLIERHCSFDPKPPDADVPSCAGATLNTPYFTKEGVVFETFHRTLSRVATVPFAECRDILNPRYLKPR